VVAELLGSITIVRVRIRINTAAGQQVNLAAVAGYK